FGGFFVMTLFGLCFWRKSGDCAADQGYCKKQAIIGGVLGLFHRSPNPSKGRLFSFIPLRCEDRVFWFWNGSRMKRVQRPGSAAIPGGFACRQRNLPFRSSLGRRRSQAAPSFRCPGSISYPAMSL